MWSYFLLRKFCIFVWLIIVEIYKKNRFINECARKKIAKIPESQNFYVRCIRTYALNKGVWNF